MIYVDVHNRIGGLKRGARKFGGAIHNIDIRSVIARLDGLSTAVDSMRTDIAALISNRGSNAASSKLSSLPFRVPVGIQP